MTAPAAGGGIGTGVGIRSGVLGLGAFEAATGVETGRTALPRASLEVRRGCIESTVVAFDAA